ncbi:ommochrome-binding protein-like [Aricia agestis]|uniref:ommochrome-binding protein-like n=1 Tax=Aricia agestis TaxID=91739 RepID=UPI001C20499B|nr:ommochrome-binding protein-like [Aricia agestis]
MILIRSTLLVLLATYTSARRVTCHACINRTCYSRDLILRTAKFSGQLAIDRTSDIVYFHYQNKQRKDYTGAFDLDAVRFQVVPDLGFTFGHAVDQNTRDLYASGMTGIYRYNPEKNTTELYALKDKTIWHLQYTDRLYYNEFKGQGIYTYTNRKTSVVPGTNYEIDDFIVDKNNDIYFMANDTVYVLRNGTKTASVFENEIYVMATDINGEAYFAQTYTKGIYKIDYRTGRLLEYGAFRGTVVEFVFDSDNHIIYYDEKDKSIYYLSPTLNRCTVNTKNRGRSKLFSFVNSLAENDNNGKDVKIIAHDTNEMNTVA